MDAAGRHADRSGLAVAGGDVGAEHAVCALVGTLGFDLVDAGRLRKILATSHRPDVASRAF